VPAEGRYQLVVFGFVARETADGWRHSGEQVIESWEAMQLSAGSHRFSFGFIDGFDPAAVESIDLVVALNSLRAGEPIELRPGINYYAMGYDRCMFDVFNLPCLEHPQLHLELRR
jgi:hypothetical protein